MLLDVVQKTRGYEIISEKIQSEGYTGTLTLNVMVGYSDIPISHIPPHLEESFKIVYAKNHLSKLFMIFFLICQLILIFANICQLCLSGSQRTRNNQESDIKISSMISKWNLKPLPPKTPC